jgi:hypothetical protein
MQEFCIPGQVFARLVLSIKKDSTQWANTHLLKVCLFIDDLAKICKCENRSVLGIFLKLFVWLGITKFLKGYSSESLKCIKLKVLRNSDLFFNLIKSWQTTALDLAFSCARGRWAGVSETQFNGLVSAVHINIPNSKYFWCSSYWSHWTARNRFLESSDLVGVFGDLQEIHKLPKHRLNQHLSHSKTLKRCILQKNKTSLNLISRLWSRTAGDSELEGGIKTQNISF